MPYAPVHDAPSSTLAGGARRRRPGGRAVRRGATRDRGYRRSTKRTELVDRRALVYRQINTATSGKYRTTKTSVTDPARSAVLVDVRFVSLTGKPYSLYVLHDVGLGLNPNDDTGRSAHGGLVATDGVQSGAVMAFSGSTQRSSGYLGTSDPWSDLSADHSLTDSYSARARGNAIQRAGPASPVCRAHEGSVLPADRRQRRREHR